jgi:micrococcal nuclease
MRPRWQKSALIAAGVIILLGILGALFGDDSSDDQEPIDTTTATSSTSTSIDEATTTVTRTTTTVARTTTTIDNSTTTSPSTTAPPDGVELALVVSVTDGDTVDADVDGFGLDTIRLIGINTPESGECYADEATAALTEMVLDVQVQLTSDVSDRDQYDRLLRYIWLEDGTFVNEAMVAGGFALARAFPPDTEYEDRLDAAEQEARDAGRGLWAEDACGIPSDAEVRIVDIRYDAPGNDNENLNEEWVDLENQGNDTVALTGWVVKDETASHRFNFPSDFTLDGGAEVRIFTGCGTDSGTELFWCSGRAVWNNDGDTAFLLDVNGNIADEFSY